MSQYLNPIKLNPIKLNPAILLTGDTGEEFRIPFLEGVKDYFISGKFLRTVIVIAIAAVIWIIIKQISRRRLINVKKGTAIERNAHFVLTFAKVILVFLMVIIVLQVNGVNVTSLVAGLGLVSVIVGFAFQDLLADWIKGISIATEHFYNIGDVIQVGDLTGRVIKINLKVTQIQDILTGSIVTMDNRLMSQVMVLSGNINLFVPIPYTMKASDIGTFLDEVVQEVKKVDGVVRCESKGLHRFDDSKLTYLMVIVADDAFKRLTITRAANGIILDTYEKWGLAVPYNQLDVHIN